MSLSKLEKDILEEIKAWEEKQFMVKQNDLTRTYDEWLDESIAKLPEETKEKFFSALDQWMFYIQATIQQSNHYESRVSKLINDARVFDENIQFVEDLKNLPIAHLNFLAEKQKSVHNMFSLIQGGISASGSTLFLGLDLPAMIVVNLRSIQLIAASYGYDTKHPFEMVLALKLFYCATLPKRFQQYEWEQLIKDITTNEQQFFYEGKEQVFHSPWMNQILIQLLKGFVILLIKNRKIQNIPFLSIALGASVNYSITKNVTEISKRFYQYRYLMDKEN